MKALKSIIGLGVASMMLMPVVVISAHFFGGKYDGPTAADDTKLGDALVKQFVFNEDSDGDGTPDTIITINRDEQIRGFTYIFGAAGGRQEQDFRVLDETITDNFYTVYCHDAYTDVLDDLDKVFGRSIEACIFDDTDLLHPSITGVTPVAQVSAPWHKDWRVFSSDLNVVYYNPTVGYTPWGAVCDAADTECTNADFTGVRNNPWGGTTATIGYVLPNIEPASTTVTSAKDLGKMYRQAADVIYDQYDEFRYEVWVDDKGYTNCADGVTSGCAAGPKMGVGNINYVACSTNLTNCNGEIDLWDSHYTISIPSSGDATVTKIVYADPTLSPIAALSVASKTQTTLSGTGCFTELVDPTGAGGAVTITDWATKAKSTVHCLTLAQARQNIADWYQYNRRRSFVAKWAVAELINSFRQGGLRSGDIKQGRAFAMGMNTINKTTVLTNGLFVEVPDSLADNTTLKTAQDSLLKSYYAYEPAPSTFPNADTPLLAGLARVGSYFEGTNGFTSPLAVNESECQRNVAIVLTDGYWNDGIAPTGFDDEDGDNAYVTLADIAKYYYEIDLAPTINNLVTEAGGYPDNDKTTQHMVTSTVSFGVFGDLSDTNGSGFPDSAGVDLTEAGNWGNPTSCSDCPEKIDDAWHAAYNGRGLFVSASTPEEVADALQGVIPSANLTGSGAATTTANSSTLTSDTALYLTSYSSGDWVGELRAKSVTTGSDLWSTNDRFNVGKGNIPAIYPADPLTETDGRQIMTFKPSEHKGIAFHWPSDPLVPTATELDLSQIDLLKAGGTADEGKERLFYLRGKTTQEARLSPVNAPILRDRVNTEGGSVPVLLGDVINSSASFIGKPPFLYPTPSVWPTGSPESLATSTTEYDKFKLDHDSRTPMVAVGANDGMLHLFNGSTGVDGGTEIMAYIPGTLMKRTSGTVPDGIAQYTDVGYDHKFFVNAPVTVVDAFGAFPGCGSGKCWRTVLVSGLGGGAQGVFALDITDPAVLMDAENPAKAGQVVLWEFTDYDDPGTTKIEGSTELGLVLGQPSIVRLASGEWAAVFGNGYNNTTDEDNDGDGVGDCAQASGGTCTASSTGSAVLFIVDLVTGNLIKSIDTGVDYTHDPAYLDPDWRPNGLSEVGAADVEGDVITDYIYAGDLFGNLWKFDMTGSTPADWKIAYNNSSCSPCTPLFKAYSRGGIPQAITAAPEIGIHAEGGYLVYFGTGKYFEEIVDANSSLTSDPAESQTFYAVWDRNIEGTNQVTGNIPYTRQHLLKQSFATRETITNGSLAGNEALILTVDGNGDPFVPDWYNDPTGDLPSGSDFSGATQDHLGWMVDIFVGSDVDTNYGARVVSSPRIFGNKVAFATLIPPSNACDTGTDGALILLNKASGAAQEGDEKSLLGDIKGDGDGELADGDIDDSVSGIDMATGSAPSMPKRITQELSAGHFTSKYFFTDAGGSVHEISIGEEGKDKGRYGWKQLW